jgi:hypothetical protein
LVTTGRDAAEVTRGRDAPRTAAPRARPARRGLRAGGYISAGVGENTRSTPARGQIAQVRLERARIRGEVAGVVETGLGIHEDRDPDAVGALARDLEQRAWPACSAPIVGTARSRAPRRAPRRRGLEASDGVDAYSSIAIAAA